jgi:hypothetical protein
MRPVRSLLLALALGLSAAPLSAQTYGSLGLGAAVPTGDFGDIYDTGYTIRGQAGVSLVLADVHLQTGVSRFSGQEIAAGESTDDIAVYHAGAGARLGLGLIWVGANAAYFFGDGDDGVGFFPEVGVGIGPIEVVADYRIDGDFRWLALRGGWRF